MSYTGTYTVLVKVPWRRRERVRNEGGGAAVSGVVLMQHQTTLQTPQLEEPTRCRGYLLPSTRPFTAIPPPSFIHPNPPLYVPRIRSAGPSWACVVAARALLRPIPDPYQSNIRTAPEPNRVKPAPHPSTAAYQLKCRVRCHENACFTCLAHDTRIRIAEQLQLGVSHKHIRGIEAETVCLHSDDSKSSLQWVDHIIFTIIVWDHCGTCYGVTVDLLPPNLQRREPKHSVATAWFQTTRNQL
ncbi:hypothetical protein FIBSPDRAFT_902911 [Athelia psychrophila]|uniref:Uncharacterized protein n=1 Tax=Athelia psychrophila TaxID=1759441 RepID=A0A167WMZ4_9AGAM|nr:hypothetical protein FIBSPDRAFT_902911 [Fibularhizoctonia sp. CBS 109695]